MVSKAVFSCRPRAELNWKSSTQLRWGLSLLNGSLMAHHSGFDTQYCTQIKRKNDSLKLKSLFLYRVFFLSFMVFNSTQSNCQRAISHHMDDEVRIWVDSFLKTKVHGSENFTIQHLATYEQKSNQSSLARNCSLEKSRWIFSFS